MALIVQKYGGTSVGDLDRIANVARRAAAYKDRGNDMVVVLSAMSGETDRLLGLAKKISPTPPRREVDVLISTGEQVTIALLAVTFQSMGHKAKSYCGWQIPLRTDSAFGAALIEEVDGNAIKADLAEGYIVVVAGFQGVDPHGNITTLGRGGSDTSAVAVAAALGADRCQIFTDVDGVYTADPNIVPQARKLARVGYDEMMEMASLGAKVLQIRAVELAKLFNVPLEVLSSFNDNPGTLVTEEDGTMEKNLVTGVNLDRKAARITMSGVEDKPGIAAHVFSALAEKSIVIDMIIQNSSADGKTDITFTVPAAELARAVEICNQLKPVLGAPDVTGSADIAKVSIVGAGMVSHPGVAAKMFSTLSGEGINIEMISTSEIKISCVVRKKYAELAVRALHDAFDLDKNPPAS